MFYRRYYKWIAERGDYSLSLVSSPFGLGFLRDPWVGNLQSKKPPAFAEGSLLCGEGGIRTPGTLIEYASLANWWIKPLSHLSNKLHKSIKLIDITKKNYRKFKSIISFFFFLFFYPYFLNHIHCICVLRIQFK